MTVAPWHRGAVWLKRALFGALVLFAGSLVWWTRGCTRWPETYVGSGPSMEPTVKPGEVFTVITPVGELRRGMLVVFRFHHEDDSTYHVLRRLAALPGDTLGMQDGRAIVNGQPMDWPFQVLEPRAWRSPLARVTNLYTWGPLVAPRDSVLLLSDLRDVVGWPDSRFIGPVAIADLVGAAQRMVWTTRPGRLGRRLD